MSAEPFHLRVLSYNVHKGFSTGNTQFILDEIREGIRQVDADLVFLQEVVGENRKHSRRVPNWVMDAQFEYLADSVWSYYAYGKNAVYDHGHHGNAMLSNHPFLEWDNVDVSMVPRSRRGLLFGRIDPGIQLVCVHMGLLGWERRKQVRSLIEEIRERVDEHEPLIIAGDFNDWNRGADRRLRKELGVVEAYAALHGRPARSYPAGRPLFRLDRIYSRGFEVLAAECLGGDPWNDLSDHRALYADLRLKGLRSR